MVGTPSYWKLSTSKPRAEKVLRSVSNWLTAMPGVLRSTSRTVSKSWSSMRWRVMTLTDCGVSRRDSTSPVALAVAGVVYEFVPSVLVPRSAVARTAMPGRVAASLADGSRRTA